MTVYCDQCEYSCFSLSVISVYYTHTMWQLTVTSVSIVAVLCQLYQCITHTLCDSWLVYACLCTCIDKWSGTLCACLSAYLPLVLDGWGAESYWIHTDDWQWHCWQPGCLCVQATKQATKREVLACLTARLSLHSHSQPHLQRLVIRRGACWAVLIPNTGNLAVIRLALRWLWREH